MANVSTIPDVVLTIGSNDAKTLKPFIQEILVESELDQPDMIAITLSNFEVLWSEKIEAGAAIEVKLGSVGGADTGTVFKGEVTGIEPRYDARNKSGDVVVIRGFNALHVLARGKNSVSFAKMTDKAIVEQICGDHSLTANFGDVAPSITYEHVYQYNQTDLEFLRLRAARIGRTVRVQDKTLFFTKRSEKDPEITLKYGISDDSALVRFMPRLSTANQVSEVHVRGWDPEKKDIIVGVAPAGGSTSSKLGSETGAKVTGATHTDVLSVDVNLPSFTKEEADEIALAIFHQRLMSFITGDATALGNPNLKPGAIVKIEIADKRFAGDYLVSAVRHRAVLTRAASGYQTEFKFRRDAHGNLS